MNNINQYGKKILYTFYTNNYYFHFHCYILVFFSTLFLHFSHLSCPLELLKVMFLHVRLNIEVQIKTRRKKGRKGGSNNLYPSLSTSFSFHQLASSIVSPGYLKPWQQQVTDFRPIISWAPSGVDKEEVQAALPQSRWGQIKALAVQNPAVWMFC